MKHALLPLALVFLFVSCQNEELITHQDLCDDLSQESTLNKLIKNISPK